MDNVETLYKNWFLEQLDGNWSAASCWSVPAKQPGIKTSKSSIWTARHEDVDDYVPIKAG